MGEVAGTCKGRDGNTPATGGDNAEGLGDVLDKGLKPFLGGVFSKESGRRTAMAAVAAEEGKERGEPTGMTGDLVGKPKAVGGLTHGEDREEVVETSTTEPESLY
jgi:hypothetical protein